VVKSGAHRTSTARVGKQSGFDVGNLRVTLRILLVTGANDSTVSFMNAEEAAWHVGHATIIPPVAVPVVSGGARGVPSSTLGTETGYSLDSTTNPSMPAMLNSTPANPVSGLDSLKPR